MTDQLPTATVFVDPQCPFAWITARWLRVVQRAGRLHVDVELMSLACVNEHQELDPAYRAYNDDAWAAARVASALLASPDAACWPAFYDAFGRRRHVLGERDNRATVAAVLHELGLPPALADAADDPSRDADLRARTRAAVAGVDGPGGTPITRIGARSWFGPVLTAVPEPEASVRLWDALSTVAEVGAFASIATRRDEHLDTHG